MKKRVLPLILAMAIFLTACSAPVGITSPSVHNQTNNTSTTGQLDRASDYSALIRLIRKAQANLSNYPTLMFRAGEKASGAPTAQDSANQAGSGKNYSQTNIQVAGVDEADIIKTDGHYLYMIANNRLYIVDASNPADLRIVSTTVYTLNKETDQYVSGESPMEMFLDVENNRLVLIVTGWINEKIKEPVETQPEETKPTETAPTETQPSETVPSETLPNETIPDGTSGTEPPTAVTTAAGAAEPGSTGAAGTASSGGAEEPAVSQASGDTAPDQKMAGSIWFPYYNQKQYTTTIVYDLADRANPALVRKFSQTGYYVSSRKIDSAVYVVTNQYQYRIYAAAEDTADPKPADIFPATSDETGDISLDNWDTIPADSIAILPKGDASNQMVLAAIDTLNDASEPDLLAVLGSSGTVYASTGYLYIAAFNYLWNGMEASAPEYSTDIFRFKLAGAKISEAGKGSVPGSILNQFSMDEYNGYFRIATTTYGWQTGMVKTDTASDSTSSSDTNNNVDKNHVYILDSSLRVAGKVENMAPGESIKSVRFMGDQAYVVTFRNVDPLFVLDLSTPASPKILGQLKIPGFSTYLHPYKDGMLLGFGYDVKVDGESAYTMGLKVSLFDISDFANPREVSTIVLGDRGSYADILYNHKTLLFSLEKNMIAFPAMLTKSDRPLFQGLLFLEVDGSNQLKLRGGVTHFDKLSDLAGSGLALKDEEYMALYGFDAIYRGAWIDNTLYTYSNRMIRSFDLNSLEKLGEVELPGFEEVQKYYYGVDAVRTAAVGVD